nr:Uncharacterised protein [Klebsiella pneumoniae]
MFSFTHPMSPVVIALLPNKTKIISTIQKKEFAMATTPFPRNAAENPRLPLPSRLAVRFSR